MSSSRRLLVLKLIKPNGDVVFLLFQFQLSREIKMSQNIVLNRRGRFFSFALACMSFSRQDQS